MEYISTSYDKTIEFGKELGKLLFPGSIVGLFGDLATGKTVLTKGILKGLGKEDISLVTSPSFIIMQRYKLDSFFTYHFDLYRLSGSLEIQQIGWDEYLNDDGVCIIEWAQRAKNIMPDNYLKIELSIESDTSRKFNLYPEGDKYSLIIDKLKENENIKS